MKKLILGFGVGLGAAFLLGYKISECLFIREIEPIIENMEKMVKSTGELDDELQSITREIAKDRQELVAKDA